MLRTRRSYLKTQLRVTLKLRAIHISEKRSNLSLLSGPDFQLRSNKAGASPVKLGESNRRIVAHETSGGDCIDRVTPRQLGFRPVMKMGPAQNPG